MSKSSNNGSTGDTGISTKYIDYLVNAVNDMQMTLKAISDTHKNDISERKKEIEALTKSFNKGDISSKQYVKSLADIAKGIMIIDYDVKSSTKFNKAESSFITKLSKSLEGQKIDSNKLDKVLTAISNLNATGLSQGEKEMAMGVKSPIMKGSVSNKKLEEILKEIKKNTATKSDSDSKLQNFFGDLDKKKEKRERGFVKDLIEGIASSKFVGGALGDLIKLGGLMFNNWTQGRGKFMEGLGKVVLVLSQILSGLLSGGIITNILGLMFGRKLFGFAGNLLKGGFNLLKSFFKGGKGAQTVAKALPAIGTQFKTDGAYLSYKEAIKSGSTHDYAMKVAKAREASDLRKLGSVATKAGKGASIFAKAGGFLAGAGRFAMGAVRGIPGLVGSLVATPLANKAVSMGANAYVAHGLSGAAQGALFGAMFGPIGAGIGAAIGGIAGLIKGHFARQAKEQDESKNFWQELLDMLKNSKLGQWLGFGQNNSVQRELGANATVEKSNKVFKSGTSVELLSGKHKSAINKHLDIKKMTEADWRKADTLDPIYGSMGNILNLGKMSQKRAREVVEADIKTKGNKSFYEKLDKDLVSSGSFSTDIPYAARGTSAKVRDLLERAKKEGFDTSNVKITSAIGTLGSRNAVSPHSYTNSATGHFSEYGTTIDISDLRKKDGTRLTRADLKRMGLGDYYLYNNETDHADHEHLSLGKYAWMEEAKIKGQQQQKITAQKHSIDTIGLVAKLEGKEKADAIGKAHLGNEEAFKEAYENELKKYGITHMKDSKGKERWYYHDSEQNVTKEFDPSANIDFLKKQMTYMTNNVQ